MSTISTDTPVILNDLVSENQLLQIAAEHLGLVIDKNRYEGKTTTSPLATYLIVDDTAVTKALEGAGFQLTRQNGMLYLDHPEVKCRDKELHEVSCWEWRLDDDGNKKPFYLNLRLTLSVNQSKRGVVGMPLFWGNNCGGPCYKPIKTALLKALTPLPNGDKYQKTIEAMVANNCECLVGWHELGFGGIRSLRQLFREFVGNNPLIKVISERNALEFSPDPNFRNGVASELFLQERLHNPLMKQWEKQLDEFRSELGPSRSW